MVYVITVYPKGKECFSTEIFYTKDKMLDVYDTLAKLGHRIVVCRVSSNGTRETREVI